MVDLGAGNKWGDGRTRRLPLVQQITAIVMRLTDEHNHTSYVARPDIERQEYPLIRIT